MTNVVVVMAVTATAVALVRLIADQASSGRGAPPSAAALSDPPPGHGRLAFVKPESWQLRPATADDPLLRASVDPDAPGAVDTTGEPGVPDETLDGVRVASWSTEVAIEKPAVAAPGSSILPWLRAPTAKSRPSARKHHTLTSRLAELSPIASARLGEKFAKAKAPWPPAEVVLVAIKDEKAVELHARSSGGTWQHIHRYRVLAASGGAGPKLLQGDRQVPEGLYAISFLNPNSAYHVSMRVNYPNAFDREMATKDGRKDLGGDIMIHGKNLSAGCLAVGDDAAEELFVLAAQVGLKHIKLIIAPTDFRKNDLPPAKAGQPEWLPKLYAEISTAMADYKVPQAPGLLSFFMKGS